MSQDHPFLSVIVPVHDGAHVIPTSLDALCGSEFPRDSWELIVVDDASRDDTAAVAARYADAVIRIPGRPHGPAYARNRGAEVARGDVLVFIDADVVVHGDTLSRTRAAALPSKLGSRGCRGSGWRATTTGSHPNSGR